LSHVTHEFSPTLAATELKWFWKQYVPEYNPDAHNTASPLYSILNAGDDVLRRLPACFIATAGQDPLHDDGIALFRRLQARQPLCARKLCPLFSHAASLFSFQALGVPVGFLRTASKSRA
jgi:acetyl esterase/lipase